MLRIGDVNHVVDFQMYIKNFFDERAALEIWGNGYRHYWDKWEEYNSVIAFWQSLDIENRKKLIDWYERHYTYPG